MVKNIKISCEQVFGDLAKNVYYSFDMVFMKESIEKKGIVVGENLTMLKGYLIDEENLLAKLFCEEHKWIDAMHNFVVDKNFEQGLKLFNNGC